MTESATSPVALLGRWRIGRLGPAEFAVLALIGAFLSLIGAFDTDQVDAPRRLVYWVVPLVAGGACAGAIEWWLESRPGLARRPWLRAGALVLLMAIPSTAIVLASGVALFGGMLTLRHCLILYPQVVLVCAGLVGIAWLARRRVERVTLSSEHAPPPLLREKLPPRLARARLLAVQAEDHYLRVHTDAGDALLLMRFTDALQALNTLDGVRTHRSWWVARSAVEEARWSRGRGDLTLVGGLTAPVSRAYAEAVRAVDWA